MTAPIPIDAALLQRSPLPSPEEGSKEARGRIAILGGSTEVPGPVLLAGLGALRAGAGKLQIATVESRAAALGVALPEALVIGLAETSEGAIDPACFARIKGRLDRCGALLAGPGMIEGADTRSLAAMLIAELAHVDLVLDAGALDGLRDQRERLRRRGATTVLTPHSGEMANLLGVERAHVDRDPLRFARDVAADLQAVVVMKGSETFIADPTGAAWRYAGGGVGLATSGSGDVLAGIIAGLIARGASASQASCWGVYLHGEGGTRLARKIGALGFLAREIATEVPALMEEAAPADRS